MTLLPNHCAWGMGRAGGPALRRRLTPQSLGRGVGRRESALLYQSKQVDAIYPRCGLADDGTFRSFQERKRALSRLVVVPHPSL